MTAAIASQSARTLAASLASLVRPCTATREAPEDSSMRAKATVRSGSSKIRILAVTGIDRCAASVATTSETRRGSSIRKAPYRPLRAMRCGQPRLRSMASTPPRCSRIRAAASTVAGSLPQNWASRGLSASAVENCSAR